MTLRTLSLLLSTAFLLVSCSDDGSNKDAEALLSEARTLSTSDERADQERAVLLFDSLHKAYPTEVSLRKEAIYLSRQLRLKMSEADSADFADRYATDSALLVRMDPLFVRSKHPTLPDDETVMRYRGYEPQDARGKLFLDILLRHDASLQIVVGTTGDRPVRFTSVKVEVPETGAYEVSDTIPISDKGRNYLFSSGGQTRLRLTLSLAGSERIASFIALKAPEKKPLTLSLMRDGKEVQKFALTPSQTETVTETYCFYATYVELKNLEERMQRHALYRSHLRTDR